MPDINLVEAVKKWEEEELDPYIQEWRRMLEESLGKPTSNEAKAKTKVKQDEDGSSMNASEGAIHD